MEKNRMARAVESYFAKNGIRSIEARSLLKIQFLVLFLSLALGYLFAERSLFLSFAVGALLITFNFFVLARVVSRLVWLQKGAVFPLLVSFYSRLILTGLVLYLAIVVAGFSVISLLLGLSTVLVTILIWSSRVFVAQKLKEA